MGKVEPPVLAGTRLRVWWPNEEAWFTGTVKGSLSEYGTHLVVYDDGDERHEPLGNASLRWERLDPALATRSDDEAAAEASGQQALPAATALPGATALPAAKEKLATACASRALQRLTIETSTDGLDDLLSGSPITPERFLADYWERTVLHLPRDDEAAGTARSQSPTRSLSSSSVRSSASARPSTTRPRLLDEAIDEGRSASVPPSTRAPAGAACKARRPVPSSSPSVSSPTRSSVSSSSKASRRPEGAFNGLLRLEDLDALFCHAACPAALAEVLIFEGLRQVDAYATPYAAFASRASVVVNHADKVWPPAYELCARLGRRFGHAYANLYLTPGDSQTAPPHSDDRDVFVLQLHGEKAWRVWRAEEAGAQPLPYKDEMVGKGAQVLPEAALGEPHLACTLRPGHLLYIPRGAPHVAHTAGSASPSMHLTIAIPTADLCWSGLARQAAAAATGLHGRASPRASETCFRRALPLGPLPSPPPEALARGPALTAFLAESASRAAAPSEAPAPAQAAAAQAAAAQAAAVARCPGGPSCDGPPGEGRVEEGRVEEGRVEEQHWSSTYDLLHAQLCGVTYAEARQVLDEKLERKAEEQAMAMAQVARQMAARGAPMPLLPETVFHKQVELQLFDGGRVVQTKPAIGSEHKIRHTFIPPAMLPVVRAFMALPADATFALEQLPAPDAFVKVCAVRQLMALHALVFLPKEEAERWRRRRSFQDVDLRGVIG